MRTQGRIDHIRVDQITPFAAPLLLEVGKVPIRGQAEDRLFAEATDILSVSGLEAIG